MPTIDAIEVIIRMSKGEGEFPVLTGIKASAIKKSLSLSVDAETLKSFGYTHYRVIKKGEKSDTITITDGAIDGYPTLQVRLYSYPDMKNVKANPFGDDRVLIGECFSYKVDTSGGEFFFIDANGYTDIRRVTAEMKPPEFFDQKIRAKAVEL